MSAQLGLLIIASGGLFGALVGGLAGVLVNRAEAKRTVR